MSGKRVVLSLKGLPSLCLTARSGRITVTGEERPDVVFESGVSSARDVAQDATGRIAVTSARWGSAALEVRCPTGTNVVVGTASGRVELRGRLGEVRVTTLSGRIEVDQAEALDLRSVSGSIAVVQCERRCRVQTKSGRTTVGIAEDADLSTVSGRVRLDSSSGSIQVRTASGSVEVGTEGGGDVDVQTISGSVRVEVPEGVRPAAELRSRAGRCRCECPEGRDCRIVVSSMSGKIEVLPC
jgi:ferric-dicitrate binding protein FerR (iron transport regulator)